MWPNLQETADLITFTEEILNGKLHFCAVVLITKQFTGLIGLSHVTASPEVANENWMGRSSPRFRQFKPKHLNTILHRPSSSRDHQIVTVTIHCFYCLMSSGKWKPNTWYRRINITTFIFSGKKCLS